MRGRAGDGGPGPRQLLSIGGAILADPALLILDEATSSVDTRTEGRIQQALLRLRRGRTSFVIAHRLSTIRDADKVVVIDNGQIYCDGMPTHYGCPEHTMIRRWTKEGIKPGVWLLTHATEDTAGTPSVPLFPLHFCPSCAQLVLAQLATPGGAS